ncbi:MAG: site-2 protease family protein [Polyangiales bacterium]
MLFDNVLRFVALIGALVFVHELGHFVWARVFGVKVLKFSLGFGPRVIGYRHGETDYCVSLIPIGGYVKMLGEDPSDRIAHEDVPRAFHNQRLWKRFVIVLAGPAMSLLFPVGLYFVVFLGNTDLLPPVIGTVVEGYPAESKLLPGDRVLAIDGVEVRSFREVREAIAASPDAPLTFDVARGETQVTVRVTPVSVRAPRSVDDAESTGFLGVAPGFALPVIGVRGPSSPAMAAGLRSFDIITMYAGIPIRRRVDLDRVLGLSRGATVPVAYLRPQRVERAAGGLMDLEVLTPAIALFTPEAGVGSVPQRTGIDSSDLYVSDVDPDGPERQMGLRRGARIIALDDVPVPSWEVFRERITEGPQRLRALRFSLDGHESAGAFALRPTVWSDEFGQRHSRLALGIERWSPAVTEAMVPNPSPVLHAARSAWRETGDVLRFLTTTLVHMVRGRVPMSSVGGPIMIYDVSRSSAGAGPWGFMRLMALVSLNLGLLNLLPIPVLDGGHLLFFALEAVTRRPVKLWVRQTLSALGLLVLLGFMALALHNDLARRGAPPEPLPSDVSPRR